MITISCTQSVPLMLLKGKGQQDVVVCVYCQMGENINHHFGASKQENEKTQKKHWAL